MPSGISSINILTGLVVTTFGVSIQFNGKHKGHIWIPFKYQNCVEGKNRKLCDNENVVIVLLNVSIKRLGFANVFDMAMLM